MLTSIRLRNFRCFEDHTLPLKPVSIVIGRNNAGKSTLVEAFRLLATVSGRYQGLAYKPAPSWGGIPRRDVGVTPSLRGLEIRFDTVFYQYGDPPAAIDAHFASGHSITLYLGAEGRVHAVIRDERGDPIRTKASARNVALPRVEILPQIGPLSITEPVLTEDYVRSALSSNLSSLHFRNQLSVFSDRFKAFKELAEATWPGLQVHPPTVVGRAPDTSWYMEVRNESFVGEAATMGHGLQMWLQTMWFLARVGQAHTVILDEPDVYMHPDLQRRLIRFLRARFPQVIITTHSVEIMAEVEAEDILVIDRSRRRSAFTRNLPAVQKLIDHVGSVHNIHLAKLWHARRLIFSEGDDVRLLSQLQLAISTEATDPLSALPNIAIGGWGGWKHAVGSSVLFRDQGADSVAVYCILDSDYWTDDDISERYAEANRNSVRLHVWSRKEIENCLLSPAAVARYITGRLPRGATGPDEPLITRQLESFAEARWDETFDSVAQTVLARDRALGAAGANRRAREILAVRCPDAFSETAVVSGKALLADLSSWSQSQYGVSISATSLARGIGRSELPTEVAKVITAILNGHALPEWRPRY